MNRTGGPSGPFANMDDLLKTLVFEPLEGHPESPTLGDVIMYRDGGVSIVGTASQVSYGPREEMQSVARLFPREQQAQESQPAPANEEASLGDQP